MQYTIIVLSWDDDADAEERTRSLARAIATAEASLGLREVRAKLNPFADDQKITRFVDGREVPLGKEFNPRTLLDKLDDAVSDDLAETGDVDASA